MNYKLQDLIFIKQILFIVRIFFHIIFIVKYKSLLILAIYPYHIIKYTTTYYQYVYYHESKFIIYHDNYNTLAGIFTVYF